MEPVRFVCDRIVFLHTLSNILKYIKFIIYVNGNTEMEILCMEKTVCIYSLSKTIHWKSKVPSKLIGYVHEKQQFYVVQHIGSHYAIKGFLNDNIAVLDEIVNTIGSGRCCIGKYQSRQINCIPIVFESVLCFMWCGHDLITVDGITFTMGCSTRRDHTRPTRLVMWSRYGWYVKSLKLCLPGYFYCRQYLII